jgi:hypothetical protein
LKKAVVAQPHHFGIDDAAVAFLTYRHSDVAYNWGRKYQNRHQRCLHCTKEKTLISARLYRYGPALLMMALIFFFSSLPGDLVDDISGPFDGLWRKVGHVVGYALLAFAFRHALGPHRYAGRLTILAAALYAVTDELHQAFTPGRGPSVWDVALDTAAAAGAVLLWHYFQNKQR